MQKAALLLWLLFSSVFACDAGFESCLKKTKDLKVVATSSVKIPLSGGRMLVFSKSPLNNALKNDPFLHLYLFKTTKKIKFPFKINRYLSNNRLASLHERVVCGKILQPQKGLDKLGVFSKSIQTPSLVVNGCCELVGIGTKKGVVQKAFIEHFLRHGGTYGDLGVRVADSKGVPFIRSCNPFLKHPFKSGDRIIALNGKKVREAAEFCKAVLFAPVGSTFDVVFERNGEKRRAKAKVYRRKGGGYISDTFLETVGIYVDEELRVTASSNEKVHKGDRLVVVDSHWVKTQEDVRKALSSVRSDELLVGVNRRGLEIFIKLKRD